MSSLLATGAGALLFVGLVGVLGAVVGRWALLPSTGADASVGATDGPTAAGTPGAASPSTEWLRTRAAGLGLGAATVVVLAMAAVFARQLAEFRDPFVPWTEDADLLLGTAWGTVWKAATAAALATFVAFAAALFRGGAAAWILASLGAAALAFFPGLTGHAAGDAAPAWMIPADAVHVLAAGAWMGGLALVLHLERAWRRSEPGPDATLLPTLVPRFSRVAIISVAALVLTGAAASWIHLPSPAALLEPGYGRLLALKLVGVAGVLALGALNWKRHTPRLDDPDGAATLRRTAAVELALGTLVLLVTAVLVRTSPTGG